MNSWIFPKKETINIISTLGTTQNAMCVCFLRNCAFQMVEENGNAANINNQWKLFV